jgi:hypothetical protein
MFSSVKHALRIIIFLIALIVWTIKIVLHIIEIHSPKVYLFLTLDIYTYQITDYLLDSSHEYIQIWLLFNVCIYKKCFQKHCPSDSIDCMNKMNCILHIIYFTKSQPCDFYIKYLLTTKYDKE